MKRQSLLFIGVFILLITQNTAAQNLLTDNFYWQQAVNTANQQMVFNEAVKSHVMKDAGITGKSTVSKPSTVFIKTNSSTAEKLAAQTTGEKATLISNYKILLKQFYDKLKLYRLAENDMADGMALALVVCYNVYNGQTSIDENGLKVTAQTIRAMMTGNVNLLKQTDAQRQESMETAGIAAFLAQATVVQSKEKATLMAANVFKSIFNTAIATVSFGSNGFFKVNAGDNNITSVKTLFTRKQECLSC